MKRIKNNVKYILFFIFKIKIISHNHSKLKMKNKKFKQYLPQFEFNKSKIFIKIINL